VDASGSREGAEGSNMIFDVTDTLAMWDAVQSLRSLRYAGSQLVNTLAVLTTLDDPYYMSNLSPGTYGALVQSDQNRAIGQSDA